MGKSKLTLEDVRTIQEVMGGARTQTAIPTVQVPQDSFKTFTASFVQGWPFITGLIVAALFIVNNFSTIKANNDQQDVQIQQNSEAIKSIEAKLDASAAAYTVSNNDIVRRLDSLQTAVDNLKGK